MSETEDPGFAYVRKPECAALMRCKPSAALALIFIRSTLAAKRGEDQPFRAGSRDFGPCGLGRDAAASALQELEREGVIACDDRGSFARGKKATWRLVHTRAAAENTVGKPANRQGERPAWKIVHRKVAPKNTAGKSANPKDDTAGKSATIGRKTRQLDENTAGKSGLLKDTPAPAEQEQGAGVSVDAELETAEAERRQAFKESLLRIECAARAAAMPERSFIEKAGGLAPADFLARKFARGELNALELRKRLADSDAKGALERDTGLGVRTMAKAGTG